MIEIQHVNDPAGTECYATDPDGVRRFAWSVVAERYTAAEREAMPAARDYVTITDRRGEDAVAVVPISEIPELIVALQRIAIEQERLNA